MADLKDFKIRLVSPYEKARKAGLKSVKDRRNIKTDRCIKTGEYFWDTSGPRDAFDAHPLARKAHVYGSSLK